jgi:hypothetical protein
MKGTWYAWLPLAAGLPGPAPWYGGSFFNFVLFSLTLIIKYLNMKQKLFVTGIFLCLSAGLFAQCTVDVFINGVKSGQYMIKKDDNTGGISYKKAVYKNMERLSVEVKGNAVSGPAIRTIEIMGDGDTPIYTAVETEGVPGQFILSNKAVLKRLIKGKPVKLMLISAPSNPKMMQPTRKTYIGTISRG